MCDPDTNVYLMIVGAVVAIICTNVGLYLGSKLASRAKPPNV
jgi:hypothetical protein